MAQQSLNNNVTFGEQRTKINDNFTELYTNKVDSINQKLIPNGKTCIKCMKNIKEGF